MSKVYTRVMDDHAEVIDPLDPQPREFCLIAHCHFKATSVQDAMRQLGEYFAIEAAGGAQEMLFTAGQMTVGRAVAIHSPRNTSEVTH